MYPNIHCSAIYNSQDMETTYMFINRGMVKKMWYIYATEHSSAIKRNGIVSFAETWLDLQTLI